MTKLEKAMLRMTMWAVIMLLFASTTHSSFSEYAVTFAGAVSTFFGGYGIYLVISGKCDEQAS